MSRIVNIGDFYRYQTSFPSVIDTLEGSGTTISPTYTTFGNGTIESSTSGTTGPIDIRTFSFPPNVGQSVSFSDPDLRYTVSTTGSTGDFYYFTISPPFIGEGIVDSTDGCFIYSPGISTPITNILVSTPSSGDTLITTSYYPLNNTHRIVISGTGGTGPSAIIASVSNTTSTGSVVYIDEILEQDYTGYNVYIQRLTGTGSTGSSGNPIARANAHAKRQFGNHPRIQ